MPRGARARRPDSEQAAAAMPALDAGESTRNPILRNRPAAAVQPPAPQPVPPAFLASLHPSEDPDVVAPDTLPAAPPAYRGAHAPAGGANAEPIKFVIGWH